jgi:hypothetical protein
LDVRFFVIFSEEGADRGFFVFALVDDVLTLVVEY